MGEPLYEQVVGKIADGKLNRPCRIYAPVGSHETLLAYLVRRLLENGANTSFVNRIADHSISLKDLVLDPVLQVEQMAAQEGAIGLPHPRIALPRDLYGKERVNSAGLDLANEHRLGSLSSALLSSTNLSYVAEPMLGCDAPNPASRSQCATRPITVTWSATCAKPASGCRQRHPLRPGQRPDLAVDPAGRACRRAGARR